MSYISSRNRWLSSISQRKTPSLGLQATLALPTPSRPSPGRAGPRDALRLPGVEVLAVQHSLSSCLDTIGAVRDYDCGGACLGPLSSFDYMSSGLGESRVSFRLSSLFPGSSWLCWGTPYQSPSLLFQGFLPFSYHLSIPQARLLPFKVIILAPMHMPHSVASSSGFHVENPSSLCTPGSPIPPTPH